MNEVTDPKTGMVLYMPTEMIALTCSEPSFRTGLPELEDIERWHNAALKDQHRQSKRRERTVAEVVEDGDDEDLTVRRAIFHNVARPPLIGDEREIWYPVGQSSEELEAINQIWHDGNLS